MRRVILGVSALVLVVMAGCSTPQPPAAATPQNAPVRVQAAFDERQALALVARGVNAVSGSALIRQSGGGVVTCAGLPVMLVPATAYAKERVERLYGNSRRGYASIYRPVVFADEPPQYRALMRETLCDAQGRFSFDDVADGQFFVVTVITWQVGIAPQGGGLMQAVEVTDGQRVEVVLSPQ